MTFNDQGFSWFLAQLKPNCANIADKNLKRQGFKTFLPMEEGTRKRNGKFITAMRPLFPGYILWLLMWHEGSGAPSIRPKASRDW